MPIKTFANQMTADVAAGLNTKHARLLPQRVWTAARRKLDIINAASATRDIAALPGNRFEDLKHTKPGFFSIRINDQYRIFFRFEGGNAYDVEIEGYDHTGRR
jgi:proteic killer suppression protein